MTTVSTHNNLPDINFGDDPISNLEQRFENLDKLAAKRGLKCIMDLRLPSGLTVQKVADQFVKELVSK
ncbi:hypothetical protein COB21_02890 [Candidatus Aerophobetes bacterium]|uniref:Uncharacterized protein n=1 Tax=Aerophobetes bacterium TaxID=2030807 RepID=A0A2A4X4P9_UNCAE|nr:MAG: hypothetical protein COB21_02890 [Candidatus Aerophobetes bacterium]